MFSEKEGERPLAFGSSPDSLNSPEGIALDAAGRIYIADWGNHRVLVFNNDGTLAQKIGGFGENKISGDSVKFIFPTRIAVAEDTSGVLFNGKKYVADQIIFVADRNGVHLIDAHGFYLATVMPVSSEFPLSSFYGIAARGFGKSTELFVVQRQKGEILRFVGKTSK